MRRGPYKDYLDPTSSCKIPRTTLYSIQKRRNIQYSELSLSSDSEEDLSSMVECSNRDEAIDSVSLEPPGENITIGSNNTVNSQSLWDKFDYYCNEEVGEEDEPDINLPNSWFEELPDDDDQDNHNFLDEVLCNCTTTKKNEAIAIVLLLALKHSWTWESVIDLFSAINALFGKNVVPTTKYKLFKYFPLNDAVTYHLYCTECQEYMGKRADLDMITLITCDNCAKNYNRSKIPFFLTFNLQSQLKQLLEYSEVQNALADTFERRKHSKELLEDIYDGYMYKKFSCDKQLLRSKYNLSYTFSTDGCQSSKSSRMSAWPIHIMIHELPPKLRKKHMLTAALWVSNEEPNMNVFLQPFVDEANLLSTKGVEWTLNGEKMTSKVFPLCGCFDSVARCKVLNMKQYNGYYGCTFCQHEGELVGSNIKFTISEEIPDLRTDDSIKQAMAEISENKLNQDIKGVKGPSALMNLLHFDLVDGMIPDYMHAVLIGVIQQHTNKLLFDTSSSYYVGNPNNLLAINKRLLSIKHPSCITRATRRIEDRSIWKASEWRSWLLFYSLICLDGILEKKYLHHLALLVSAMYTLLSDKLSEDMINNTHLMLVRYVIKYQKYFGKESMTYNVHLLLHLPRSVDNWGPLYTQNAFCFENENRILLQYKKSPAHITLQIAKKYFLKKSLMFFVNDVQKTEKFEMFCKQTLSRKLKNVLKINNVLLITSGVDYKLTAEEEEMLNYHGHCKIFNRMIVNNFRYTSESYRSCEKINDSIIETETGKVGIITKICFLSERQIDNVIVFYREILLLTNEPFLSSSHFSIQHIQRCSIENDIHACNPDSISKQGYLVNLRNRNYYVSIPKGCYGD